MKKSLRALIAFAAIFIGLASQPALAADEMFVSNFGNNSITVYPRAANGNVTPARILSGAATGLNGVGGVAVDGVHSEMFVANSGNDSITVYALTANGNVAPIRTIAGAATGLNEVWGIFVDPLNNELFVANNFGPGTITVYARTASGNAAPLRTLSGAATSLDFPINVAVDTVNNELIVANATGTPGQSITVYTRTANGNAAPLRNINGAATGFDNPVGVAVDTVNNELVESNYTPSVSTFPRTASGNATPVRSIAGAATGLTSTAGGVALDTTAGEVFVVNYNGNSITVYPRTANGNALPLRTVAGNLTGLANPAFVAITTSAPPPTDLTLITPQTGAVIAQNHNLAFCPSDPTRGVGYQANFRWAYTKPPSFNHFHLHVQRVGAPTAALDRNLSGNKFWFLACNRVVVDSELGNWFWQVTAIDNSGGVLATSEQRPFSFAPCRLANGTACAP